MSAAKPKTPAPVQPLMVGAAGVAKLTGLSEQGVRRADRQGRLPRPIKTGSSVRWDVAEIALWVKLKCPNRTEFEARLAKGEASPTTPSSTPGS